MKTTTILTALAALFATAGVVTAKPNGKHRRPAPPLLLPVLDSDMDGELSAEEIANASAALLEIDKNEDGELTRKEIVPRHKKGKKAKNGKKAGKGKNAGKGKKGKRRMRPGPPILVKTIDLDDDRVLSADEIEEAPTSLLTLDTDNDGALSRDEMRPPKPEDEEL